MQHIYFIVLVHSKKWRNDAKTEQLRCQKWHLGWQFRGVLNNWSITNVNHTHISRLDIWKPVYWSSYWVVSLYLLGCWCLHSPQGLWQYGALFIWLLFSICSHSVVLSCCHPFQHQHFLPYQGTGLGLLVTVILEQMQSIRLWNPSKVFKVVFTLLILFFPLNLCPFPSCVWAVWVLWVFFSPRAVAFQNSGGQKK